MEQRAREAKSDVDAFEASWRDCAYLTPRQAYAIAAALDWWADLSIGDWLKDPASEPLHQVSPFYQLDLRVMMHVNENRAWAARVAEHCNAVSDEIASGVLPFDRPGPYIDELLVALALRDAQESMEDVPEIYEQLPARSGSNNSVGDEDWDAVSDTFDDRCQWDE